MLELDSLDPQKRELLEARFLGSNLSTGTPDREEVRQLGMVPRPHPLTP